MLHRLLSNLTRTLRRSPRFIRALVSLRALKLLDREGLHDYAARSERLWPLDDEPEIDVGPLRGPIVPPVPEGSDRDIGFPYPWSARPGFVCELRDVSLVGHKPMVVTQDGRYVLDSIVPTMDDNVKLDEVLRRVIVRHGFPKTLRGFTGQDRIRDRKRELGLACLLTDGLQRSYYHWVLEQATKLRGVDEFRRQTGETPVLVLPRGKAPWMLELIDLVGYGDAETFEWRGPRDGRAERLVMPSYPEPTPATCRWLRERVLGGNSIPEADRNERILIVRGDGPRWWRRAIVNQAEVEAALGDLGFRAHKLAELSVSEQARLFAGAEIVVGAHGAGFTNLVFSTSTSVLELFGRDVRPHFARLSHVLALPYRYLLCDPASVEELEPPAGLEESGEARTPRARDARPGLKVDIDELVGALGEMGVR